MRHRVDCRKFGRKTSHRMAMLSNMAWSLLQHERIETTLPKAKDVRRVVERLITRGKRDSLHSRRLAYAKLKDRLLVKKLFEDLGPRFRSRKGGYTRILKKAMTRYGDGSKMAIIELVDYKLPEPKAKKTKKKKTEDQQLEKEALAAVSPEAKAKKVHTKKRPTAEPKQKPATPKKPATSTPKKTAPRSK